MARVPISRAMRTSCSWFSINLRRICCCAISVSRLTDSCSRSNSSLRRYQNAEMMAARNSSTEMSGATVAKRSCSAGDWRRHQRPMSRVGRWAKGRAGGVSGIPGCIRGLSGEGMLLAGLPLARPARRDFALRDNIARFEIVPGL
jgi:hypothetical protein